MVPINYYFFLMSFKRAPGIYINDYFFASSYLKVSIRILELDSSEERKSNTVGLFSVTPVYRLVYLNGIQSSV